MLRSPLGEASSSGASFRSDRTAYVATPSRANTAAATRYAGRHESLATSVAPPSGVPSDAPTAHAPCSAPMKRTSPRSAASVFTAASRRPRPEPRTADARLVAAQPLASAKIARAAAAAAREARRRAIVPTRSRKRPLAALAANCATVIAATRRPSPASGASSEVRIAGQAIPSMPVGRPRQTRTMNAIAAAGRRTRTCKGYETPPCDDLDVSALRRVVLFGVISIFTLGLGLLALLDGIGMLAASSDYGGNDRTALLGLGALTTAGALVPIALWVLAGWALFIKREGWGWGTHHGGAGPVPGHG